MTDETVPEEILQEDALTPKELFAELELIPFDDPRVHTAPPEFDFDEDGDKAKALSNALIDHMLKWRGIGLSANQVGLPYKVFAMGDEETRMVLFNPTLVSVSEDTCLMREGCLTYPGLFLTLERPSECTMSYQNVMGEKVVQVFPGLAARIALHEYDHMNGMDYTVHASKFKVDWELSKLRKTVKKIIRHQRRSGHAAAAANGRKR